MSDGYTSFEMTDPRDAEIAKLRSRVAKLEAVERAADAFASAYEARILSDAHHRGDGWGTLESQMATWKELRADLGAAKEGA